MVAPANTTLEAPLVAVSVPFTAPVPVQLTVGVIEVSTTRLVGSVSV